MRFFLYKQINKRANEMTQRVKSPAAEPDNPHSEREEVILPNCSLTSTQMSWCMDINVRRMPQIRNATEKITRAENRQIFFEPDLCYVIVGKRRREEKKHRNASDVQ